MLRCEVMDVPETDVHCDGHYRIYTHIKSLCCTHKTNTMIHVDYISMNKQINRPRLKQNMDFKNLNNRTMITRVIMKTRGRGKLEDVCQFSKLQSQESNDTI